jgi:branched-chain amino acid transport system permease protein
VGGLTGNATALRVTVAILVLLAFVPLLHSGYYENLCRGVLMFATLSFGWNILGGYTGYVSFGNVVFFGIGTYTSAALWQHWHQQSLPLAIAIAMVVAAAFAILLGIPILRLRGHYFAIATLGIALATEEIVANIDWLGAGSGQAIRPLESFSSYYVAMWIVCAASMLATYLITRSKLGYALVAIRENEEAAAVLGVDAWRYKVIAWAISAAMAAAAGAVFAGANGFIDPPTAFATDDNVFPIVMALLGGVSTVAGPLIAVIVLVVLFLPRGLLWLLNTRGGWRGIFATFGAYRV